ncbi:MAG TPA: hydroxymethylpyrimidine/phosphomethylpyrimidine kinase [Pedobacter sp.]|uniref:hydroxymethylpyrimidine/phosphomethylpyrimidine kinase n=1 Tax=Pedobacter sp. TaxID=1411316 RepID=UPI002B531156|nr:hydroxymethylpyrimidine/phosphomethylpyrimidine kinase [Pedobacter sp.]HMI01991.1 hydroxymethylpyrimidine/phosphomethylpyrimidine kinase [Pedobacter sp.]
MLGERPYVISIAGFDPSGGAGILADVKCFEQHQVYGFGVCSALTVQTDDHFISCEWINAEQIITQLEPLFAKFRISACKIGLIKDIEVLLQVLFFIRAQNEDIKIILDPVLKASAGFQFHQWSMTQLNSVLRYIDLITPNYSEMLSMGSAETAEETAGLLAAHCPVLLKGGHNIMAIGTDLLFENTDVFELKPRFVSDRQKHGSGCVLSAAITANLALGHTLNDACKHGKIYIEDFLNSNSTLLGYHSYDR